MDIPTIDMNDENFEKKLAFEIFASDGCSAYRNDRERSYNGQPQTSSGVRGKQLVEGLTMRDIRDCLVMALLQSAEQPELNDKVENNTWLWNDVYKITDTGIDYGAVGQNLCCNIERMMGIFPNVYPLTENEISEALSEEANQ